MLVVDHVVAVDEQKCIGCKACDFVCPTEAIVTTNKLARVEEALCTGCNKCIDPGASICPCTGTRAREVVVAILDGARSMEEITLRTGVRGVCSMWCTAALLRLMEVAGLK